MRNGPKMNLEYPTIVESESLYARALGLVPACTQTLAKGPGQYVNGVAPKFAARGKGGHVWDVDGNEYVHWQMGIGPIALGYRYPAVDEAIAAQLEDGITFSLMHPLEVEVAELVREVVPGVEMVRYSKTGCDVTSAAIRLARAATGKDKVLCCGYHGWHDWYVSVTDRDRGSRRPSTTSPTPSTTATSRRSRRRSTTTRPASSSSRRPSRTPATSSARCAPSAPSAASSSSSTKCGPGSASPSAARSSSST